MAAPWLLYCVIRATAASQSVMLGLPKIELHSLWFGFATPGGTRLCSGFDDMPDSPEVSIGEAEVVAWKEKTRNQATLPNNDDEYGRNILKYQLCQCADSASGVMCAPWQH